VVIIGITAFPRVMEKSYHEPEKYSVGSRQNEKLYLQDTKRGSGNSTPSM
jgi:hypothetical protein